MPRSRAEHLDRAVTALLSGSPLPATRPATDTDDELSSLIAIAQAVQRALSPVGPSAVFEARLAERLVNGGVLDRALRSIGRPRVILTGAALSSAALGLGLTAYALWRGRSRAALATRIVSR